MLIINSQIIGYVAFTPHLLIVKHTMISLKFYIMTYFCASELVDLHSLNCLCME